MDGDPARWLFDPHATRALVLAHRSPGGRPVDDVVSDVVWGDVVRLLRWAAAGSSGPPELRTGTWWRLAAGCAALLRRLPALSAEVAQPWTALPPEPAAPGVSPAQRIDDVAARLATLLRTPEPVDLRALAPEVDALGEAAVQAIATSEIESLHRDG
ncbi:hypothetical protein SAMN05660657_01618 [Geodermatophilus amargosae]|uniref:Uncharacterized protein n=1 Tax=Geodermatophilus amargosae TaxID=1296565 RepID=A0A1I6Z2D9_9ACTN|nr:hypothetical protein [Geodermatophilus amargosae]SFT56900.1 hypothetical protein SAMN05660657_01618 [Geodermatophilus amargosae]